MKLGSIVEPTASPARQTAVGKKLKSRFFAALPAIKLLLDDVQSAVTQRPYLYGLDRRILHVRSKHSALNTLLQSAGAVLVKLATVIFHAEAERRHGWRQGRDYVQVLHVHKAFIVDVKPCELRGTPAGNPEPSPEQYMAHKPLVLEQDRETGCIVPVSHKLNQDGYFRKRIEGRLRMYHVYIWELKNGPLRNDHEVHHTCGNRACCNPSHLEAIPSHEHTIHGNRRRYADRYMEAALYWLENRCTGTELGEKFGVTFSTGCQWIRDWKGKAQRLSDNGVGPREVAVMLARSARQKMCRLLMI